MSKQAKITIGIMAHVDAGKTTLSEQFLFRANVIRKAGRVDHKDTFLDGDEMERSRGITIFSKEAELTLNDHRLVLLDTPGHVDFSAEAERCLSVMDYCILLISAPEGIKSHTLVLWKLLEQKGIPTFLFVNKIDQFADANGGDSDPLWLSKKSELLEQIRKQLSAEAVDFSVLPEKRGRFFWEEIAMCDEHMMECFLEAEDLWEEMPTEEKADGEAEQAFFTGRMKDCSFKELIRGRKLFPVFFGSALKEIGLDAFFQELAQCLESRSFPEQFGGRIFKISRDAQGQRMLHVRLTGGSLGVREEIAFWDAAGEEKRKEKVTQLRILSGGGFLPVERAEAGDVVAILGPSLGKAGEGLGFEQEAAAPSMVPVLGYQVSAGKDVPQPLLLEKLRMIEEENPELSVQYEEEKKQILIRLMGRVQTEILKSQMEQRFGISIELDEGQVLYRETIEDTVEGVGHFEPLRHYAEVHLLLEPLERGKGIELRSRVSSDLLATNWQRLILQHLSEKQHRGVLTGSPITDMRITLVAGKAHPKHTEGGDFRQATYRAVRQGLMQASSLLLEPYYSLQITAPTSLIGRVLSELDQRAGSGRAESIGEEASLIIASAPVATVRNFAADLAAFSGGRGRVQMQFSGYEPCHNTQEVLSEREYDPERDIRNRADSVFVSHGSSLIVPWDEVFDHMDLELFTKRKKEDVPAAPAGPAGSLSQSAGEDELRAIFEKTFKTSWEGRREEVKQQNARTVTAPKPDPYDSFQPKTGTATGEVLLVDGYNLLFAHEELSKLARDNLDAARGRLLDLLSDYQGTESGRMIVVFDAYKTEGGRVHKQEYHNIEVVFTKEQQTADMYIEKTVHEMGKKARVSVVTSDGLEQIVAGAKGALLVSSREFLRRMEEQKQRIREEYLSRPSGNINPIQGL
ncbi:MAG: TetM/TetW/TetO/TetS family tetracycline resistance ribosomal protection protein [Lachnospiraceae bacterium]|nr:TetM/TetW/TetO/TetS family tetracycline resistance ribosomal protection protein [Lachnospiraceae bacterium]